MSWSADMVARRDERAVDSRGARLLGDFASPLAYKYRGSYLLSCSAHLGCPRRETASSVCKFLTECVSGQAGFWGLVDRAGNVFCN